MPPLSSCCHAAQTLDQKPLGVKPGQLFASISGTKTSRRAVLVRILQLGFAVEVVERSGNVSKTYEPGRVEGLPALDVAGSNLNRVKLRVVSLRS
jgi:hypothetical protein